MTGWDVAPHVLGILSLTAVTLAIALRRQAGG